MFVWFGFGSFDFFLIIQSVHIGNFFGKFSTERCLKISGSLVNSVGVNPSLPPHFSKSGIVIFRSRPKAQKSPDFWPGE